MDLNHVRTKSAVAIEALLRGHHEGHTLACLKGLL